MRTDLPTGTVTFLFTDVEGSTKLLHDLGAEGYAEALAEHRRVIRGACARHGGVEVDTQGDAFFFAFPTVPGALAAAEAMTESLAPGPIQVRVGLHTGTPLLTEEGYVGDDVHFGARVAASGHGGQVVLSSGSAALVEAALVDLGEHRLKDIPQAVSIFQLGAESFPPLKTISNTNLPRSASSFLGREHELEQVLARIAKGARLLTLTGPGGTGKTRLALEAAATLVPQYKAGVFWVGLASLRDPALVSETIAQVLGAKDGLASHIEERELLLLIDNLEQVVEAAPELSVLLQACPNLTLLCTSRELLRVQGEVEYPVPPLAIKEAIALFCERSQLEASDDIAELCRRLDSLPLAVELAAARTKVLSPAQILERLSGRLDLLKGGRDADPRQQTLRATIEWSYDLLSEDEHRLFARLSVFSGGCTLEAAEEVADADLDTLQSLVEKSLLRFTNERYWMLETIREFAGTCLQAHEDGEGVHVRHATAYLALAELAREGMEEDRRGAVVARLEAELPNLRAALAWYRESESSSEELRLLRAMSKFWLTRDHLAEGESVLEEALARIPDDGSEIHLRVSLSLGEIAMRRGRLDVARSYVERWVDRARAQDDASEIAWALSSLASISMREEDFTTSVDLLEEGLGFARPTEDGPLISNIVGNLAYALCGLRQFKRAAGLCREAIKLAPSRADTAIDHSNLGLALLGLGDLDGAASEYRQAISGCVESGHFFTLADALVGAGAVALERGLPREALAALLASDSLREELGAPAEPLERELRERIAESARSILGADVEHVSIESRSTPLDEAVRRALASIH